MDENYLTSILDNTEQCCKLLLCSLCKTLPREIVTLPGQEAIICISCAEKQYSNGNIPHLSLIHFNVKYNKVLALLNRTFRTLYELNELGNEPKDHIEEKKEAIREGVLTCLNLLRPPIRDNQQIISSAKSKKKIILSKKSFDILQEESDDENNKENQTTVPVTNEQPARRKTSRGKSATKRPASSKQDENASPSKRTKRTEDLDTPLPIISPSVAKKTILTNINAKPTEAEEGKKVKSIRLVRKVQQIKDDDASKTTKLAEQQEIKPCEEKPSQLPEKISASFVKPVLSGKCSIDARNDKGESLIHQAVKKGDLTRVKQLISDGHPVNTIDNNSWTPLHEKQVIICKTDVTLRGNEIKVQSITINYNEREGKSIVRYVEFDTYLLKASAMGNIPIMELLLAHNANINVQGGQEQMTVLHEAILNENLNESIIKFLLENGADPNIKNKDGKTALDLAKQLANPIILSIFAKSQCKNLSHNDVPIAPPPRRRARTVSSATILFLTGFDKAQKEAFIKTIQTTFGRKCVTTARNVETNITHVIASGETDKIAFRTINYLRGIALGKWIVSEKWLEESIKQKQWVNENDYEIVGSQIEPTSNGPHISRIKHEQNEPLLFNKCQLFLYGQFHTYKKEDIADLIKITGAVLLKREPKLHRIDSDTDINNSSQCIMTYIIYESSIPDILLDNNRIKHIKLIDFLACIDHYDTHGRLDN